MIFKKLFSKRSLLNLVSKGKHEFFLYYTSETEEKALIQRKLSLQQEEDKIRRYYHPTGKGNKILWTESLPKSGRKSAAAPQQETSLRLILFNMLYPLRGEWSPRSSLPSLVNIGH